MMARTLALAACALLAACAGSEPQYRTESHFQPATAQVVDARFSADEARIIRDYYSANSAKAKKKGGKSGLPPGIAKNLARGKPLPPGIAKRYLPADLLRRLPPVPAGYERIIVTGKILLVEIATQVVHDILTDAMFG